MFLMTLLAVCLILSCLVAMARLGIVKFELKQQNNLGNQLSLYFSSIANNRGRGTPYLILRLHRVKNPSIYYWLPVRPDMSDVPVVDVMAVAEAAWEMPSKTLWRELADYGRALIDSSMQGRYGDWDHFRNAWRREIVIHYRLSDVPFNRHPSYPMALYSYWRSAIEACDMAGIQQVSILCSLEHGINVQNTVAARALVHDFYLFIRELVPESVEVIHCSGSVDFDFERMRYASTLISSFSSLSCMAGVFGHNQKVIKMESKNDTQWPRNFLLLPHAVLAHEEVTDYTDHELVIRQLRGSPLTAL